MSVGPLVSAHAYEVAPQQSTGFLGGLIPTTTALQQALDDTYVRSKIHDAPSVTFDMSGAGTSRAHPIRDAVLRVAFGEGDAQASAESLASQFGAAMDRRSSPSLLMVSVHVGTTTARRRVVIWTFPRQEVFQLSRGSEQAKLDILDAFIRKSSLRKAALLEGTRSTTSMLTARVLDLQSTAIDRAVADLWTRKFLQARMQMSSKEGTVLLARVLRQAHGRLVDNQDGQEQLTAAIVGLRSAPRTRWSISAVADAYLSGEAKTVVMETARPDERRATFEMDKDQFDRLVQFRRFKLDNGIVVAAPFVVVGDGRAVTISDVNGARHLRAEGIIEEEQVRNRG